MGALNETGCPRIVYTTFDFELFLTNPFGRLNHTPCVPRLYLQGGQSVDCGPVYSLGSVLVFL